MWHLCRGVSQTLCVVPCPPEIYSCITSTLVPLLGQGSSTNIDLSPLHKIVYRSLLCSYCFLRGVADYLPKVLTVSFSLRSPLKGLIACSRSCCSSLLNTKLMNPSSPVHGPFGSKFGHSALIPAESLRSSDAIMCVVQARVCDGAIDEARSGWLTNTGVKRRNHCCCSDLASHSGRHAPNPLYQTSLGTTCTLL